MQRKKTNTRLLNVSLDYSKVAVCIYSNEADGESHENYLEDLRKALEKQIEKPKEFVKNKESRRTGKVGLELKEKWSQIEYLIECIYNGRTDPCVDGFELYKVEKKSKLKLFKMDAHLPINLLENAIIEKAFDDDFEAAMIDYEISFHLLEEIVPEEK